MSRATKHAGLPDDEGDPPKRPEVKVGSLVDVAGFAHKVPGGGAADGPGDAVLRTPITGIHLPLSAAREVHERIDAGGLGGKIVLLPWPA